MASKPSTRRAKSQRARPKSSREKVRTYRKRMRAKGMRLVQLWVPDTRAAEFAKEAARQSLLANESPSAAINQAWAEALATPPQEGPLTFDDIADIAGSVDGPATNMRYKKQYLRATGYGRKRHR
jgi:hypothetical protein